MTCVLYGVLGATAIFGLRLLVDWMTYVNNRD